MMVGSAELGGAVMIWWFFGVLAGLALLAHRNGPNAVWGTATFGGLIGVAVAVFRPGFDWSIIGKAVVIGALVGLIFHWLPKILKLAK